jgi:DNA-binding transcriptional regulator LsrR (DeoR family)
VNRSEDADGQPFATRRGPQQIGSEDLSSIELTSTICGYFCQGYTASDIRAKLEEDHGIVVKREFPYQRIGYAARQGWIQYVPPRAYELSEKLRDAHPWLQGVRVVETALMDHVARAGAGMLLQLLQQNFADTEAHVGFSGGHAMRQLAFEFAQALRQASVNLPSKIVLHAMVTGFEVFEPTTDPNTFFTLFVQDSAILPEIAFVGLHAPPVVSPDQVPKLRELAGIRESYEEADKLDIIVTSARDWQDEHSVLRRMLERSDKGWEDFQKAGAVGDLLWRPIGRNGPVDIPSRLRTMTLKDLREVHEFVESGKRVLLIAGPCAECRVPKTEIVDTILSQRNRLITHLVTDSRCARDLTAR